MFYRYIQYGDAELDHIEMYLNEFLIRTIKIPHDIDET